MTEAMTDECMADIKGMLTKGTGLIGAGWVRVLLDEVERLKAEMQRPLEVKLERLNAEVLAVNKRIEAYLALDCPTCLSSAWDADGDFCMLCRAVDELNAYKRALELACVTTGNLMDGAVALGACDKPDYWLEQARKELKND